MWHMELLKRLDKTRNVSQTNPNSLQMWFNPFLATFGQAWAQCWKDYWPFTTKPAQTLRICGVSLNCLMSCGSTTRCVRIFFCPQLAPGFTKISFKRINEPSTPVPPSCIILDTA